MFAAPLSIVINHWKILKREFGNSESISTIHQSEFNIQIILIQRNFLEIIFCLYN